MIEIILCTVFLCFLVSSVCVGSGIGSIAVCVITVGLFAIKRLNGKLFNLDKKKLAILYSCGFIAMIIVALLGTMTSVKHKAEIYNDGLKNVAKLIEKEHPEEVYDLLVEVEEKYGKSKDVILARIAALLQEGEYEKALEEASYYPDKHSKEYYSVMETIHLCLDSTVSEELEEIYLLAANDCPDWADMQINAGIVQYERENYRAAEYYFLRAYEIDSNNGMALYFQGITQYELREYQKSLSCFAKAYEAGVENYVIASMQEYIDKILEEVKA